MDTVGQAAQDRAAPADPWPRTLRRTAVLCLLAGLLWRATRYLLRFPVWGDEAMVLADALDCNYYELTQTLPIFQIAPLLFLWAERAVLDLAGSCELAVRLPSFLAGTGALVLFFGMARRWLTPIHGTLAVAVLAASYWPLRHCCEAKPYAFDLLASVGLLVGTLGWLRAAPRAGWLAFLAGVVPVAVLASYPAVFVAGAMSLVLLPSMRRAAPAARGLYVLYNVLMVVAFVGHYFAVARHQIEGPRLQTESAFMQDYWREAFPPAAWTALPRWLVEVHTGGLFAYPVGGSNWSSSGSVALAVLGVWYLWSRRQRALLAACVLPFGLTLVAAALHKYPYGGSPRVAQHLAPMACLLVAAGLARLLDWAPAPAARVRAAALAGGALAVLALAGAARDFWRPYKTFHEYYVRDLVGAFWQRVAPGDLVVIGNEVRGAPMVADWYLRRERPDMPRRGALGAPPPADHDVWLWVFYGTPPATAPSADVLGDWGRGLVVREAQTVALPPDSPGDDPVYARLIRLAPAAP